MQPDGRVPAQEAAWTGLTLVTFCEAMVNTVVRPVALVLVPRDSVKVTVPVPTPVTPISRW